MAKRRASITPLRKLLEQTSAPVYVVDAELQVAYCNQACADWFGVAPEDLVGLSCSYHSQEGHRESRQLAAALAPPPEVLAGQPLRGNVNFWRDGSSRQTGLASYLPLRDAAGDYAGVVVTLGPGKGEAAEPFPLTESESRQLHHRLQMLRRAAGAHYRLDALLGTSDLMERVRSQVRVAIDGTARTLIVGPPGSGREHLARTIHAQQLGRRAAHLIPLAGSLTDAELVESMLESLEHQRLQDADGGRQATTLLLLDADRLPADVQAVLVDQIKQQRLPHTLATARHDLRTLAGAERFSPTLASYLSTLVIELPALAHRREDIPLMVQAAVERFNASGRKQLSGCTSEALERLVGYPWFQNLDELNRLVWEACERAAGPQIVDEDLPHQIRIAEGKLRHPAAAEESLELDPFLEAVEGELLRRALSQANGNKAQAARLLGIHRQRLLRRLAHFGIDG